MILLADIALWVAGYLMARTLLRRYKARKTDRKRMQELADSRDFWIACFNDLPFIDRQMIDLKYQMHPGYKIEFIKKDQI